ncbi:aminotransferase class III-fold pyridoxal phosphate-dependent enzyme [Sinorhizobium sp. 7-81]|uniref:aminotransferase class III-fold pyridoxal phosphate-dependent enzyme n=1 Tax=Sinorhizobium sp. 8-89 TaxID=3049089 RepID=UPI0024C2B711|nr:aminotransferase class III-fold pyridoxal phosphate-dependent enzyme [Sinorhizobium sp. 8-89]MDK1494258.1 aminotransferase class III-fold pyridoxal phosphate-dependent enzyme [Sinorhizobium sp. 8-89]
MTTVERIRRILSASQDRSFPLRMSEFGLDLVVHEGVFPPEEFAGWRWATENFPPVLGLDILEIGCGFGLPGLHLARAGAKTVTSVDIDSRAVINTIENAGRNNISNIEAFESDIFSNVPRTRRFHIIFWNFPSQFAPDDFECHNELERGIIDPGYALLRRFLAEGPQWLTKNGRIILGFGSYARDDILSEIVRENGLESSILIQGSQATRTATYRLMQIRKGHEKPYNGFGQSRELTELARALYPAGVTRVSIGTVQLNKENDGLSIYAHAGEGARIQDADGNSYIDFHNNFSTLVHGHRHPGTIAAITSQLERGTAFGNPTVADIDLAQAICDRVPAIELLRFLNSGTEAVMFAIKAARAMTGRTGLAKLEGAFHGTYDWAEVSTRSNPSNWGGEYPNSNPPYLSTPSHVCADVLVLPLNDTERSRNIIEQHGSNLACILVDMLPCAAGMIPLKTDYLAMLQETAKQHGIVLISDEVVCFRLGYHGASASRGFVPDLVTLGKVVGGGLPIGIVGGSSVIMEAFAPQDRARVPQGGTFSANPLTMAAGRAALAALTVAEVDRINELGDYLREQAERAACDVGVAITAQGAGSLFRFHAKKNRPWSYRNAHHDASEKEVLRLLHAGMLERGFYVAAPFWGSISTSMTKHHVDDFLDAFRACLHEIPALQRLDRRSAV